MIILDTNVVSALVGRPQPQVTSWLSTVGGSELVTTTITRAEIRYGVERLPDGRRRDELRERTDAYFAAIADRTWAFDHLAADRYGELVAYREAMGRPISVPDAQIASIAFTREASVATRNAPDFVECGITAINPWLADERRGE